MTKKVYTVTIVDCSINNVRTLSGLHKSTEDAEKAAADALVEELFDETDTLALVKSENSLTGAEKGSRFCFVNDELLVYITEHDMD